MDAVTNFFEMGGYALYVWGAYGMAFALIGLEIVCLTWRARRRAQQRAAPQRRPVRPQLRRAP